MSTKTTFKRIALVTVAALGLSFAVAAPSQAYNTSTFPFYVSTAESSSDTGNTARMTATQVAGAGSFVEIAAAYDGPADSSIIVSTSGSGSTLAVAVKPVDTGTVNATGTSVRFADAGGVYGDNVGGAVVRIFTPTVGTVTVTVAARTTTGYGTSTDTTLQTLTIQVNAKATRGVYSAGDSHVYGTTGNFANEATDLTPVIATGLDNLAFTSWYEVLLVDANGDPIVGSSQLGNLQATIAGPGFIQGNNGDLTRYVSINTDNDGYGQVSLYADGTAGKSTITFSTGSTVIATKSVTFTGAPKTIEATVLQPHVGIGLVSSAILVVAKDANGNVVADYTPTSISSDSTKIIGINGHCTTVDYLTSLSTGLTFGGQLCSVDTRAIGDATLTIDPASTTTNSPTVTLKVTKNVVASLVLTSDKATYAPGEKITLTLTAKDADGVLMGRTENNLNVLDTFGVLNTNAATGTPFNNATSWASIPAVGTAAGLKFKAGVATATYYAPLASGDVTFTGDVSAATNDVALALLGSTLSVKVTVTDRVAPAIAAAEAATAAAQDASDMAAEATAAVAALSAKVATLVSALKKQITTLATLVAKIAKKMGVK